MIDLILVIDISSQLINILPLVSNDLLLIDTSITSISIPHRSCNDNNCTIFDISRFTLLESIEIGDYSFGPVSTFEIDGLNQLHTLKIGQRSFTQKVNGWGDDKSKSFHISNCESLESIQIGEWSFSDFGGDFELKNLPQLQSIQISYYAFWYSSFVIRGIELILNVIMNRSSKSTIHYIR